MINIVLDVKGMSCGYCVNSIEGALQDLGVKGTVDLASGKVSVEFDENIKSLDKIKEAIEEQGYDV
ncbi:cation transporter [Paenibacillus endoradicis]|uniref:cation transporter n=1 Tax=Paenibacillus endoradicis TaxID=2972487 RepID=UPI0021593598|nr:cation transporter [Paenibacillus endoradicis]MCR8657004.1 cation transporter [Paenibacillus endoradicis]